MINRKSSKQFALDSWDYVKAFFMAVLAGFLTHLYDLLENGNIPTQQQLEHVAIASIPFGIAYLLKNFITPQKTIIYDKDNKRKLQDGSD